MNYIIHGIVYIVGAISMMFVISAFSALPVMWLWNYTMPDIFNLPEISFWQALALNVLCNCLFKSTNSSSNNKK